MIYTTLLWIHIVAGTLSLLAAIGAMTTKILKLKHDWHIISGRLFFYGMTAVFLTALPMTWLRPNLFLFLIAIFSFYLAFSGWRLAVNRSGKAGTLDYAATVIMALTGLAMIGFGIYLNHIDNQNGITLIIFGSLGSILALNSSYQYVQGTIKGKERIISHLQSMMGASIAAITAFLVVNIETEPVWIAWIAPTVCITPIIFWMTYRYKNPKRNSQKNKTTLNLPMKDSKLSNTQKHAFIFIISITFSAVLATQSYNQTGAIGITMAFLAAILIGIGIYALYQIFAGKPAKPE